MILDYLIMITANRTTARVVTPKCRQSEVQLVDQHVGLSSCHENEATRL
jgi:hypothetical protein